MKNIFYSLIFIILLGTTLYSCGNNTESKTEPEVQLQAVKVRPVTLQSFKEVYEVVGTVKPYQTAKVSSEEGGLITYMPVDKGSRVYKGQVLVRLNKEVDNASYDQAITQFELAKSNFDRMEKLYLDNVTTEQDYTNAKYQLEIAENNIQILETRLSKSYVVSPISGIVDQKYLSRGEVTGPGVPVVNVVDVSRVKISAGIPERYMGEVTKGTNVKVTFDVYPDEEFSGIVNYISPVLSAENRTFEIELVLNNRDGRLKPEMSANIEITKSSMDNAIVLAQDLIVDFGDEKFVFVLENDLAKKRVLTLGGRNENDVLITSGLNSGDNLIIEGYQPLIDGDKVQVIN